MYDSLSKNFGLRVKFQRNEVELGQIQLAKKVGVSKTTIQNYESGIIPKGKYLAKLSRVLECSIDWLLIGEESPYIKEAFILEDPSWMTEKELAEYHDKIRDGKSPIYKGMEELEDSETAGLISMTREILKSDTDYSVSLAANIRSFHHAIKTENRLNGMDKTIKGFVAEIKDIKQSSKQTNKIRESNGVVDKGEILKKRAT